MPIVPHIYIGRKQKYFSDFLKKLEKGRCCMASFTVTALKSIYLAYFNTILRIRLTGSAAPHRSWSPQVNAAIYFGPIFIL